jgi:recombination protein RecT
MTDNKNVVPVKPKNDIQELLASPQFKDKVSLALPKHLTPDRFIRVACNALLRTPKLLQCSQSSLMKALLDLSTFGLEPDGRRAHLIPFGQEVQLIIDYKGLVELVRRSGDVSYIHADVVGKHDLFDYSFGSGAKLVHKPALNDRGEIYAAYSFIRLKDGSEDFDVMGVDELNAIRKRSKAANNGPWVTDTSEMYKKTVFRRHSKWQPFSAEVLKAISYGEDEEFPKKGFETAKLVFNAPTADLGFLTSGSEPADDLEMDRGISRVREEWMDLLAKFGRYDVTPAELLKSVGTDNPDNLKLDDTEDLYKLWTAIESGQVKAEDKFPKVKK